MRSSLYLTYLAAVLAQILIVLQGAIDLAQRYMYNQTHPHAQ